MGIFEKRPLALASLLLILASFLTFLVNRSGISRLWALFPFLFFLMIALLFLLRAKENRFFPLLLAIALLLGFLSQLLYDLRAYRPWREADAGARHSIVATVKDMEEVGETSAVYRVSVKKLDGRAAKFDLLLKTEWREDSPLKPRSLVAAEVFVMDRTSPYWYSQGIAGRAIADSSPLLLSEDSNSIAARLDSLRATLSARIKQGTKGDIASFYRALFLGDRSALSDPISTSFRRSGTSHLLALSGLHLSVLALAILRILKALGAPQAISFSLLLPFLFLYTAIAGFPLSLIRAAIMLVIYRLALLLRLSSDSFTALIFAVALIILCSPASAPDIGLHLSFLATLGVLVAGELSRQKTRKTSVLSTLLHRLGLALLTSLLAIAFTVLFSALVFGEVSLIAIPANLILSPIVTLCLLLAPLLLLFPQLMGAAATLLGEAAIRMAARFSELRGVYASATYPLFLIVLSLFSLYLILLLVRRLKTKKAFFLRLFIALLLPIFTFLGCHIYTINQDLLLYTRDYQHEYITLRAERDVTVIANTTSPSSLYALEEMLADAHITEIDTLVLTHYEDGVAEYLEALRARLAIRSYVLIPPMEKDPFYREARLAAEYLGLSYACLSSCSVAGGDIALNFRLLPKTADSTHEGLLLSARYSTGSVCFASPDTLSLLTHEERQSFLADADLLILGAHPKAGKTETALPIAKDCILVTAYPEGVPDALGDEEQGVYRGPSAFSWRLPER